MLPNRKHRRDLNPEPNNLEKKRKPSGSGNTNLAESESATIDTRNTITDASNPNPAYFRPIRKSEAEDISYDIAEALGVNYGLAETVRIYMSPSLPKIQFWNDYPGRATLRSWDHKIYMLGVHGPLGPLGITDEKGSYSLSRRLIGPVSDTIDLLREVSHEPSKHSWMGIRETLILTELKDGKVTTWEVAKHKDTKVNPFDHPNYRNKLKYSSREGGFVQDSRNFLDYTRVDHRILPREGKIPTYLKDQEGKIVEDAEIVVAANWYVLTLTRSGDLYFNQDLYMENVQSIATASTDEFVLILNESHEYEFHRNRKIVKYLRDQDARNGEEIVGDLKLYGKNFGDRDSSRRVVGPSVYTENSWGRLGLQADGRLKSDDLLPSELESDLADESNYVKSVAASYDYFAALLELIDEGSQEVYVWGEDSTTYIKVNFKMHSCFEKKNPENGTVVRKRISDITVSDNNRYMTSQYNYFRTNRYKDVIALNFEDNSSCLLLIISDNNLSFLTSFTERTQSIHTTRDGMLIVTDSKILKMTEPGRALSTLADSNRRYVSFVASSDGYVIVYPGGEYEISESVQPPTDIQNTIHQGNGIAEIYHDKSGTFHAILRNGTLVSWYSETSVGFRNTPKWDMDKFLIRR
jgi:hypothetical protein